MLKRVSLTLYLTICGLLASGQKFATEKTFVSFFSDAPIEDITADNEKTVGVFNASTGEIAFSVPIKEFQFAKSLMQEHFNEKYMESDKFPKSTFQGKITGFDVRITGVQKVNAAGKLMVHGVSQPIDVPGTVEKQGDKLFMKSRFIVKLEDHKIKVPQLMWQNIAEEVEVTLDFTFTLQ